MDDQAYREWWPLHLRAAKGEILSAADRAAYEEGKRRLHEEETLEGSFVKLQQTREEIRALEARRERLQRRRRHLRGKVSTLEAALSEKAKQALGLGN